MSHVATLHLPHSRLPEVNTVKALGALSFPASARVKQDTRKVKLPAAHSGAERDFRFHLEITRAQLRRISCSSSLPHNPASKKRPTEIHPVARATKRGGKAGEAGRRAQEQEADARQEEKTARRRKGVGRVCQGLV